MNPIKYTCPRCAVHTCSLSCVKKHKAWAQCSGERNPAEYRKRADLATPSSIDKDFNFITNVERSIVRADEGTLDRGINLAPARQLKAHDARPKWEMEADQRGITIIKAPKGLTRSKQTKTHWVGQHKCITWTIEWICPDKEKVVGQCLESKSVGEAFLQIVGKKAVKRKRRLSKEGDPPNSKLQKGSLASTPQQQQNTDGNVQQSERRDSSNETPTGTDQLLADLHFYLHKPTTPSKFKCLVPVSANGSIREILDGQVLLEFPTIYVMYELPEQLTLPFITEAEYKQSHESDVSTDMVAPLEDGEVDELDTVALPTDVNSLKVLEVLAKDLAG